ncbi:MAG: hypothetical protein PQJ61_12265 [Spirochaetales bacterium]|uniref:Uncharacterized protein n=1 Tax=Candidatus Thalassospirochaeta sargassi TaxID=3119039 RepID=A0AAJ1IDY6_9SPIO|nr:hypothetical protein [Spirochaetales bacterium]
MPYSGEERRKEEINVQQYMEVLVSNVKELFSSEVSSVKEQISNLEDKLSQQLKHHEEQSESKIKQFEEEIICLKNKINNIDKRVEELELKPVQTKAGWIDKFGAVFQKVLYTAIASSLLGIIVYLVTQYFQSL